MPRQKSSIPKGITTAQRDKANIALVNKLKSKGLISKQAKTHKGKFVSRPVLKKALALLDYTSKDFVGVKVNKAQLAKAKESNYIVANGRIVVPKGARSHKAVLADLGGGIKPLKRGYLEEIPLPLSVNDLNDVEKFVRDIPLDTGEQLALTFYGNKSHIAFATRRTFLEYLNHYKNITGNYEDENGDDMGAKLVIVKAHSHHFDKWIPSQKDREAANKERRGKVKFKQRRSSEQEERLRRMGAKSKAKQRQYMSPEKKEEIKRKDRERKAAKKQKN